MFDAYILYPVFPEEMVGLIFDRVREVLEALERDNRLGLSVGCKIGEELIVRSGEVNPKNPDFHGGDAHYVIYSATKVNMVLITGKPTVNTGKKSCLIANHEGGLPLKINSSHGEVLFAIGVSGLDSATDLHRTQSLRRIAAEDYT